MSPYSMGRLVGVLVGIAVGVVVIFIILKYTKKDGGMRCKWDERQLLIRGNGYKYSFFSVLILLFLYCAIGAQIEGFPLDAPTAGVAIICTGVAIDVVYCIWNGAYFSLNENRKRILIIFSVIGVINLAIGIINFANGSSITNGVLNIQSANFFCGLLFLCVFAALFIRSVIPEKDFDEE